ncbi:hypothetical protein EPUS_06999 [Endocarpon pusillum Z07020]|uniref:Uncharacterized protein n=1 Tax=Endocarpon pusillum (strain Z07020 / HMAS-L-300199) TaxID=1263415 RepID=U1GD00_ENDPU|nr:uncharacterized protein EPUS_06999 [Endocarpon pusillum Z07020]ERF75467.1 hypothetical protein EPUS_06999 [Endocarpon pusillum Z07020]
MPNKYSHSVVLAHYSSLGLIDLPNDQYIAYLKTYPPSARSSITTKSKVRTNGTSRSVTPSTGYSARYKISGDNASTSRFVTSRREYGGTARRDVILESDEGSSDEHVVLRKKFEPYERPPQSQRQSDVRDLRTEKRKLPSVSTYTGRSSSEASEGLVPSEPPPPLPPQASSRVRGEPRISPPSVINLNDYELEPAAEAPEAASNQHSGPDTKHSSSRKPNHLAVKAIPANSKTPSSMTRDTDMYYPDPEEEPNFAGFSDAHFSDVTITEIHNADTDPSPTVSTNQFPKSSTFKHSAPLTNGPITLPKRRDPATSFNQTSATLRQPRRNRSYDSISSMDSEMMHSTTALPPVVPRKAQKPLHESGKNSVASRDPLDSDDAMDPSLFETLKDVSRRTSVSPSRKRFAGLYSDSPPVTARPSHQSSQKTGSQKTGNHASPSPDFWRGLDEMLSDSDASVVFPPDIAKYKPRDTVPAPVLKSSKTPMSRSEDGDSKRPTTAPAPKTSNRDAFASNEPLPNGRSKATILGKESLDKPRDAGKVTTIRLVDTTPPRKEKNGFLKKLRKKSYDQNKL